MTKYKIQAITDIVKWYSFLIFTHFWWKHLLSSKRELRVSSFVCVDLIFLSFYLQLLKDKLLLKPNNDTCLKCKYQLKQINHKQRKTVATKKKCYLWKMGSKFWKPKFNLLCKIAYFAIKIVNPLELRG